MDVPAIYLSEYTTQNKHEYHERLRLATEEKDWEGWTLYMLDTIESTALNDLVRLKAITTLMLKMSDEIREKLPKEYKKT